jgi:hypothetical protein
MPLGSLQERRLHIEEGKRKFRLGCHADESWYGHMSLDHVDVEFDQRTQSR